MIKYITSSGLIWFRNSTMYIFQSPNGYFFSQVHRNLIKVQADIWFHTEHSTILGYSLDEIRAMDFSYGDIDPGVITWILDGMLITSNYTTDEVKQELLEIAKMLRESQCNIV